MRHMLAAGGLPNRAKARAAPPAGQRLTNAVRAPPGAQHSASSKAITARQLQALVRPQILERYRVRTLSSVTTGAIMQNDPARVPRSTTCTRRPFTRYFSGKLAGS